MVLLVDLPPIGGVVVWLVSRSDDPGVLTIAASREVANDLGPRYYAARRRTGSLDP
jgi:hypothetical protein